ncbi:prohibitin family protein [Crocosphaera sp. UHCC 0190]|uniref:prohibitin family protein n=1 Tax=Crocosphaera sp. UHCC 0190 TaxID=3110246 RepID=UPI002B20BD2B|nr:prohibitin family protein [Crocosphaera sp. UHCC 0190]MEA5509147.1 prohibitin family protein [Crocosphaera sp. UHCC 0190]
MSVILSLITALIAFLIAFQKPNLMGENQQNKVKNIALLLGISASLFSIYQIIFRFLVILPAGEVGVIEVLGKVQETPLNSGIHWISPLAKVTKFSTRLQDIKETVDATSKEGLNLNLDVSFQYKINPQQAGIIYQTIGTDEEAILIPRFRSIIRQITASYEARDIYGEKRALVAQKLREDLNQSLAPLGFIVDEVLLRNVILPQAIQKAIEEKLEAQQESQKQQFINDKERQEIAFELEKAKQEATRKKIEAQGIADSQKLLSQGLTDQLIKLKAIEATEKLAKSENSKVIIIGGGDDKLPLLLQNP